MKCPICECPRVEFRYRMEDRFFEVSSEEFFLYQCNSCGLLFQDEKSVSKVIPSLYPSGYWWEASGKLALLEATYREWVVRRDQLSFVISAGPPSSRGRLLDIGCGDGTLMEYLKVNQQNDVRGLEPEKNLVQNNPYLFLSDRRFKSVKI